MERDKRRGGTNWAPMCFYTDTHPLTTVGIDVDEVLRSCLPQMVEIYNKEFNDTKTVDDITDYDVEKIFPRIWQETGMTARDWFFKKHNKEIFFDTPAVEKAKESVECLRYCHAKAVIITKQHGVENKRLTLEWLDKNGIPYDDICFVNDKSIIRCEYFIDDHIDNFENVDARFGILITAPYNKRPDALERIKKISKCKEVLRFENINDFSKWYFDEYFEV